MRGSIAGMDWIEIGNGTLRARIARRGAALTGLWRAGWPHSLVLGTSDSLRFLGAHPYAGTVVGPIANRIGGACLRINGQAYALPENVPGASLHSGPDGLHARVWDFSETASAAVTLTQTLPDGTCGLPGRRVVTARYSLHGEALRVTLSARSDADTAMNLALHPYWNMDGTPGLQDHRLWLAAERFLPSGGDGLPAGDPAPLTRLGLTPHAPSPLRRAGPLDHNICLAQTPRQTPIFAARLDAGRGPRLHLYTTAPGLQVYDGRSLPDLPGTPIRPRAGLALEPQMWPDAPNHAAFAPILLRAGDIFRQTSVWRIQLR